MDEKELRAAIAKIWEPEPGSPAIFHRLGKRIGKMVIDAVDAAVKIENERCVDICNSVTEPGEVASGSYFAHAIQRHGSN